MTTHRSSSLSTWIGMLLAGMLLAGKAQAALIPQFGIEEFPNFDAIELVVAYDVESDTLFAVGLDNVTLQLGTEAVINPIGGTGFRLNLTGPQEGANGPSGALRIDGEIPELGYTSGTLLTGDVIDFGWVEPTDPDSPFELEVVFSITGGDAAELFGPTAGIGLTQTAFPGSWNADWVNDGHGRSVTADYAPVPLPGALLLLGSGMLGLVSFGRRRDAKRAT